MIKDNLKIILTILILVFAFGGAGYGLIPAEVKIKGEKVKISGMYGTEIPILDIQEIQLLNKRPETTARTNGLAFAQVKKGFFNVKDHGRCRLFIHSASSPFIYITPREGEPVIINFSDRAKTIATYEEIKSTILK